MLDNEKKEIVRMSVRWSFLRQKIEMNSFVQIKLNLFLLASFLYFAVSFFGFVLTSSGWTQYLVYGIGGLIFFTADYLFLCVVILTKRLSKRLNYLRIPVKWFVILVFVQIMAFLVNIGDRADAPGSHSFFDIFFDYYDSSNSPLLGEFAYLLATIGVFLYLIVLIIIQVKILRGSENKQFSCIFEDDVMAK